jgi:ADP-ribose pyrophosphatase YjhB (NUDIX family)
VKYCSQCGAELEFRIPPADNRPRHVCTACAAIHYQNPRIVAGCIAEWEGRILLCRRAIEPRAGLWTLPAGFMELGETTMQTAVRETLEEANARVEPLGLYTLMNLPHVDQVYFMYRARLLDLSFSAGEESEEVGLFDADEVPWDSLAFPTIRYTLQFYFEDRKKGAYRLRVGDLLRGEGGYMFRAGSADGEDT